MDLCVKINLLGIELLEIQARIVVAGIQTYLYYAEEMQRLGLVAKPQPRHTPAGGGGLIGREEMGGQQPQHQQQQQGQRIPVQGPRARPMNQQQLQRQQLQQRQMPRRPMSTVQ